MSFLGFLSEFPLIDDPHVQNFLIALGLCWFVSPVLIILITVVIERRKFERSAQFAGFFPGTFWLGGAIAFFVGAIEDPIGDLNAPRLAVLGAILVIMFLASVANRRREMNLKNVDFRLTKEEARMPSKLAFDFLVFPVISWALIGSFIASTATAPFTVWAISAWLAGGCFVYIWYTKVRSDEGKPMHPHRRTWKNDLTGKLPPPAEPRPGKSGWLDG